MGYSTKLEFDTEIKNILDLLYTEYKKPNSNIKLILLKAFAAGQKFQEDKIKRGIDIVFSELHNN